MIITLNTSSRTFRYIFTASLLFFSFVIFAVASYSWTGPGSSPPNSNVSAPINAGATSQVKSGALSVFGLSVYGSQYIQNNLSIGTGSMNSPWRIYAPGTQQYGVYATATNGQAIRGHSTNGGYGGYFSTMNGIALRSHSGVGYGGYFSSDNGGGLFARNSSGYYAFLGYPGSSWSVYGNGPTYTASYSRADGGFCIAGRCKTSWGTVGSSSWTSWVKFSTPASPQGSASCGTGQVMTGIGTQGHVNGSMEYRRLLCTYLAP